MKAGIITSIITLLVIIFGNTGSGFFSNLMVFIIGVVVGTPFALIGKKIGEIFTFLGKIFSDSDNVEVFQYIGFLMGALLGVALGVWLFSNKTEVGFMSECYKGVGDKAICECIYNKTNQYTTREQIELTTNPKFKNKFLKILTSCTYNNIDDTKEDKETKDSKKIENNKMTSNIKNKKELDTKKQTKMDVKRRAVSAPVKDNTDKYPECKHYIMINGLKDVAHNKNDPDTWLAIRSGPGVKYEIIDKFTNGAYVKGCAVQGNWVKIIFECVESGCGAEDESIPCKIGWAYKKYLSPIDGWNMENTK